MTPEIEYTADQKKKSVLHVHTDQRDVTIHSMETSPLSQAVSAYVANMANLILEGRLDEVSPHTITGGKAAIHFLYDKATDSLP